MFQTIRVDRSAAEAMEWLGTKRKFWFSRAGVRWLFKAEERGTGEDWAEKIACELAAEPMSYSEVVLCRRLEAVVAHDKSRIGVIMH
jgi:hypothetical protein